MQAYVKLYSNKENEILKFLKTLYGNSDGALNFVEASSLEWKNNYANPVEIADIVGVYIENDDKFSINMWICLDKDVLINVNSSNGDDIIRYLYERYPY